MKCKKLSKNSITGLKNPKSIFKSLTPIVIFKLGEFKSTKEQTHDFHSRPVVEEVVRIDDSFKYQIRTRATEYQRVGPKKTVPLEISTIDIARDQIGSTNISEHSVDISVLFPSKSVHDRGPCRKIEALELQPEKTGCDHHRSHKYSFRTRNQKNPKQKVVESKKKVQLAVSKVGVAVQKEQLWSKCKRLVNKLNLIEGAVVFGKQAGYAPWPSVIKSFNKNKSMVTVLYFGFDFYVGKVKSTELVQIDEASKDAIGALVDFILKNRCIKEFDRFQKAVGEIQRMMTS